MRVIDGGITAPEGFNAAGRHIGIKKVKKDIALLTSDVPAKAAGVYTQNLVKAAPVLWNSAITKKGTPVRGLVCISGNANACTGEEGIKSNEKMAQCLADILGVDSSTVLTASTGVIGAVFPIDTITKGIKATFPMLGYDRNNALMAAEAIMTTDTYSKEVAVEFDLGGKTVHLGGMAKGSGMVHPNMATVLSFITTDINISQKLLQKAMKDAVHETYNMISVDGATSTNDMALIMANGMAENEEITEENEFYEAFSRALLFIHEKFARDIIHDGEGASKFIQVDLAGAKTVEDARILAKSIITNDLVKTAMYGEDANWGRIAAAMGASGGYFDPSRLKVEMSSEKGKIILMDNGNPVEFDENLASDILSQSDIYISIVLGAGTAKARSYGCDLGHEYIRINGEYRSHS